jgi:hypothetical protein
MDAMVAVVADRRVLLFPFSLDVWESADGCGFAVRDGEVMSSSSACGKVHRKISSCKNRSKAIFQNLFWAVSGL